VVPDRVICTDIFFSRPPERHVDIIFSSSYPGHTIQEATEDGESLLSLACSAGYYELAEVLLRMRASVEDRGVKGVGSCVL